MQKIILGLVGLCLAFSSVRAQEVRPERDQAAEDRRVVAFQTEMKQMKEGFTAELARLQLKLDSEIRRVDNKAAPAATGGMLSFLFGAFCALWAQNTNRNAWIWFIAGTIFSVVTVIVLLIKNSNDKELARRRLVMERRMADR